MLGESHAGRLRAVGARLAYRHEGLTMKEEYVTARNLDQKAREWLKLVDVRPSRREKFRFDLGTAALLVLDMQEYFLNEASHAFVPASRAILPNVKRLIEQFRMAGRPVVYTRHSLEAGDDPGIMGRWWRDIVREGTRESAIAKLLDVSGGDVVIRKTRYSAFEGTILEELLRERGADSLAITGVTTHLCCDSTARDAFMQDFTVFLVVDATASWTEELHLSSLRILADGFAIPVMTDDLVSARRP